MAWRQLRIVRGAEHSAPRGLDDAGLSADRGPGSLLDNPGLEAMLGRALRAIAVLTGAQGGAIRLIGANGRGMRLVSAVGLSPEALAHERDVALDCGVCGLALNADGPRLETNPAACARHIGALGGGSACGPVLAVPLHHAGKAIGIFNLYFGDSARLPADLERLVEPTAQMLDVVLDNARAEHERLRSSLVAERQMLAGEVHDSLAQGLAYMRMRMPLLQDAIRGGECHHALKYFQDVNGAMGEAHGRLRELITQFRHAVDQGLLQALESTVRTFEERTGVKLVIDNRAVGLRLPPDQEVQAYQIVQEALANVIKHAGARNARIVLERDRRGVRISVEDDGCGMARRARGVPQGEHYGMSIMRERAQRIGGTLTVRKTPGGGTRVRLLLPAPPRAAGALDG